MKKYKIFIFLFFPLVSFSQQFTLQELMVMTKSKSVFESKMHVVGNDVVNMYDNGMLYNYDHEGISAGVSGNYPTNDSNKKDTKGYLYIEEKITDIWTVHSSGSEFGQEYNKEGDDASAITFYEYQETKRVRIFGDGETKQGGNLILKIGTQSEYINLLEQIQKSCKYEETTKKFSEYWAYYKYGDFYIKVNKHHDFGGTIELMINMESWSF
jgi:hypothetical protein